MQPPGYIRSLHLIALFTAAATFPLIFLGGLVTSHQAGLSVPDWPNSWGYNMFLFPPRLWIGGILYEHTHRLMGSVVGLLSIALVLAAWKLEKRLWVRWLATCVLGAVIIQGVLGGLRVVLVKLDLAIVHACFAQVVFCLTALIALVTSRWWLEAPSLRSSSDEVRAGRRLVAISITCLIVIFGQLIVGATMRHYQAGLAIPDVPLTYGRLLPPIDSAGLRLVNQQRIWRMDGLDPVTLGQIWLAFGHRIGAIIVAAMITCLVSVVACRYRRRRDLLLPACMLVVLLMVQMTLGVTTVLKRKPADVASAHVAVGALLLVTTFTIAVRAARLEHRRATNLTSARHPEVLRIYVPQCSDEILRSTSG